LTYRASHSSKNKKKKKRIICISRNLPATITIRQQRRAEYKIDFLDPISRPHKLLLNSNMAQVILESRLAETEKKNKKSEEKDHKN
jgi:hypothetical protein